MCYHYNLVSTSKGLEKRYKLKSNQIDFEPNFHVNAFSHGMMPVITSAEPEELQLYSWGLIPFWVKSFESAIELRKNTLNARSETIFEKPSFKVAIKSKRCLIPASGFFEWRKIGKSKFPYYITYKKAAPFSFAGIYQSWKHPDSGKELNTFSIVTTEANELMSKIHNTKKRQPVILDPDYEKLWLDTTFEEKGINALMLPCPSTDLEAWTVSKLITSEENTNVPEITAPHTYSEILD